MQPNSMAVTQRVVTLPAGTSTAIAPAVALGRNYLAVQNIGANDATLSFSGTAVAGQGWLVPATGNGMVWSNSEGVPSNAVQAISTAGTTLVILEA